MKSFLNNIHPVSDVILDEYLSHWTEYTVGKKTIMTTPGDTERYWYFVTGGIQKAYFQHDSKQHVMAFTYPPSFTGIPESFFRQTPSRFFLETITDSRFVRISFAHHQHMLQKHHALETLMRKATEWLLEGILERYYQLMALDMETRFKAFTERSPHLLTLIAQKDLASYLRIDPTNFSKLMNSVRI
ncbi:MAG: Crp/Fnr family transcriptional regulator [Cyclobacteriaceae bacterium]